jgi:ssDNA-specific exonuclease RecJ
MLDNKHIWEELADAIDTKEIIYYYNKQELSSFIKANLKEQGNHAA